jgi:cytoskeletal protein CcmA (bactofilin family)
MFGRKEETQKNQSIQVLNSIAAGTIIEGNVRTEGDLRVDGKVIGNIICKGRLVSGPSSEILGDILCVNGNLEGMCRGNIQVNEVLKVAKSANIDGIISTKKLTVEEGAVVQAKINMSNSSGSPVIVQKTSVPPIKP